MPRNEDEAIDYLVESNIYKDRDECIQHLSKCATIDSVIDQIPQTVDLLFLYIGCNFNYRNLQDINLMIKILNTS